MFVCSVCRSVVREVGKKWGRVGMHCPFVSSVLSDVLHQVLEEAGVMSCKWNWSQSNWVLGLVLTSSATLGSHCTFRGPQLSHL